MAAIDSVTLEVPDQGLDGTIWKVATSSKEDTGPDGFVWKQNETG